MQNKALLLTKSYLKLNFIFDFMINWIPDDERLDYCPSSTIRYVIVTRE